MILNLIHRSAFFIAGSCPLSGGAAKRRAETVCSAKCINRSMFSVYISNHSHFYRSIFMCNFAAWCGNGQCTLHIITMVATAIWLLLASSANICLDLSALRAPFAVHSLLAVTLPDRTHWKGAAILRTIQLELAYNTPIAHIEPLSKCHAKQQLSDLNRGGEQKGHSAYGMCLHVGCPL